MAEPARGSVADGAVRASAPIGPGLDEVLAGGPAAPAPATGAEQPGRRRTRPRSVAFWIAVGWLALVVFAALFARVLPIPSPSQYQYGPPSSGPSLHDLLGTNTGGQDLFSQVLHGAWVSLLVGAVSVAVGLLVGATAGMCAGYLGGWVDALVVWTSDVLLVFPGLVLALALVTFLGANLVNVMIAISVFGIPIYARVARALTLSVMTAEFVTAAEMLGARRRRIIARELVPNVALPMLAYAAIGASVAIIAEGALAFLGVSAPHTYSWGYLINQGQQQLSVAPQAVFAPMLAMFLTILSLNIVGDRFGAGVSGGRVAA